MDVYFYFYFFMISTLNFINVVLDLYIYANVISIVNYVGFALYLNAFVDLMYEFMIIFFLGSLLPMMN